MDQPNGMRPLLTPTPAPSFDADRRADDLKNAVRRWQQKTAVRAPTPVTSDAEEGLICASITSETEASLLPPVKIFRAKAGGIPKRQVVARVAVPDPSSRPQSSSLAVAVKAAAERSGLAPHPASFNGPMSFEEIMRLKNKVKPNPEGAQTTLSTVAETQPPPNPRPRLPPPNSVTEQVKSAAPQETSTPSPAPQQQPAVLLELIKAHQPTSVAPSVPTVPQLRPTIRVEAPRPALPPRSASAKPVQPPGALTARAPALGKSKAAGPLPVQGKDPGNAVRPQAAVTRPSRSVARIPLKKAPLIKAPPVDPNQAQLQPVVSRGDASSSTKEKHTSDASPSQKVGQSSTAISSVLPDGSKPAGSVSVLHTATKATVAGATVEPALPASSKTSHAETAADDPMGGDIRGPPIKNMTTPDDVSANDSAVFKDLPLAAPTAAPREALPDLAKAAVPSSAMPPAASVTIPAAKSTSHGPAPKAIPILAPSVPVAASKSVSEPVAIREKGPEKEPGEVPVDTQVHAPSLGTDENIVKAEAEILCTAVNLAEVIEVHPVSASSAEATQGVLNSEVDKRKEEAPQEPNSASASIGLLDLSAEEREPLTVLLAQADRLLSSLGESERASMKESVAKVCDPILECTTWPALEKCVACVCLRHVQALARTPPS